MPEQTVIATPAPAMTTATLMVALRAHYGANDDVTSRRHGETEPVLLVEEVQAPGSTRRCDLLRLGIWPSRGHRIIVHELKVSKADWRRELDDPAKAEAWWPYCHEFWIVAPAGLIDPAELPDGWGLMVPPASARSRRFRVRKQAASRDPKITPELLVEITRRVDNARLKQIADLNAQRDALIREAITKDRAARGSGAVDYRTQDKLRCLAELEQVLGVELDSHGFRSRDGVLQTVSPAELGAALREYTDDHVALQQRRRELDRAAQALARGARRALEVAEQGGPNA